LAGNKNSKKAKEFEKGFRRTLGEETCQGKKTLCLGLNGGQANKKHNTKRKKLTEKGIPRWGKEVG